METVGSNTTNMNTKTFKECWALLNSLDPKTEPVYSIKVEDEALNETFKSRESKFHLCAITVTVSARLIVLLWQAETHDARNEVLRAALVKSNAPLEIIFLIKLVIP